LTDGAEVSQGISAIGTGAEVSGQFGPSKKLVPNCLETLRHHSVLVPNCPNDYYQWWANPKRNLIDKSQIIQ